MRRSRRGGHSGLEFGGSGEDSFVAVVVTKLTGALLFILLLAMVIMALIPRADLERGGQMAGASPTPAVPLAITTPAALPDAVAGRPYAIALAATGGHRSPRWHVEGTLPDGLALDEASGRISGTPAKPTEHPVALRVSADDGTDVATLALQLGVLPSIAPATPGSWWKPAWPVVAAAWRTWIEQGIGFLVLWLVHLVGMNVLAGFERHSTDEGLVAGDGGTAQIPLQRRFATYRLIVRLSTLSATLALAAWMALSRGSF